VIRVIFTSDYEIHGNGRGSPRELTVDTTDRMLAQFNRFGARLTIMADVAEIFRFDDYRKQTGRDDFHAEAILDQLKRAVATGHDVQLHLHTSYLEAQWRDGQWQQDYASYDLTRLGYDRIRDVVHRGKAFLEALLQPVDPGYRCMAFRAANWSMQPSPDIMRALADEGIVVDTSVFKYGRREGLVNFDYADAWSDLIPWPASGADVCRRDPAGRVFEAPIYCEHRGIAAFVRPQRFYRAIVGRLNKVGDGVPAAARSGSRIGAALDTVLQRHAWKMDFNQCTGRQLVAALERAERKAAGAGSDVPVVLIGHSKLFTAANARSLRPFLDYVARAPERFRFGRFRDINFEAFR
jgi:hypothetical protein